MDSTDEQELEERFQLNEAADFIHHSKADRIPTQTFSLVGHQIELPAGSLVFQEGQPGNMMFVVLEGEVEIIKALENGSSRVLRTMKKGDFFGEMALIDKKVRSATACCRTDVRLVKVPEGMLTGFIERNPQFVIKMLNTFVERLRRANKIIEKAMDRNPVGVIHDGLAEFFRFKGLEPLEGGPFDVSEFSLWSHYRLGIPEHQVSGLLQVLVADQTLRPAENPRELVVNPRRLF